MKKKDKLGIDLDDVLLSCNASLAVFHNSRYGTNYGIEDVTTWDLENVWGCTKEEAIRRVYEWFDSDAHDESEPVSGSIDATLELSIQYELHIITARHSRTRVKTQKWIDRHFPQVFSGLHFTNHFENGARLKSEVCREIGARLLFDDSLANSKDVASDGMTGILFDYPWNQDPNPGPRVVRVSGWKEAMKIITSRQSLMF